MFDGGLLESGIEIGLGARDGRGVGGDLFPHKLAAPLAEPLLDGLTRDDGRGTAFSSGFLLQPVIGFAGERKVEIAKRSGRHGSSPAMRLSLIHISEPTRP